jgi:hypothetical protein
MLKWASVVQGGVKHSPSVLKLWPYSEARQHDEIKSGFGLD